MWTGREHKTTKIKDLFDIYKKRLHAPQKTIIKAFQEVVDDLLGVTVDIEACEYTPANKTLKVATNGPLKTEILIRKKEILSHLKGRLGERSAPEEII